MTTKNNMEGKNQACTTGPSPTEGLEQKRDIGSVGNIADALECEPELAAAYADTATPQLNEKDLLALVRAYMDAERFELAGQEWLARKKSAVLRLGLKGKAQAKALSQVERDHKETWPQDFLGEARRKVECLLKGYDLIDIFWGGLSEAESKLGRALTEEERAPFIEDERMAEEARARRAAEELRRTTHAEQYLKAALAGAGAGGVAQDVLVSGLAGTAEYAGQDQWDDREDAARILETVATRLGVIRTGDGPEALWKLPGAFPEALANEPGNPLVTT